MLNTFYRWKNVLLAFIVAIGLIYALPNIYGEDPAIQITGHNNVIASDKLMLEIQSLLKAKSIMYKSIILQDNSILVRLYNTGVQLKSKDFIKSLIGDNYSVNLILAPVTPIWLNKLGAKPMKLGLDLRGGVHFLIEVDVASNITKRLEEDFIGLRNALRKENIRYSKFTQRMDDTLFIAFQETESRDQAYHYIHTNFPQLDIIRMADGTQYALEIQLGTKQIITDRNYTLEQTIISLRNRINELGVTEAIVQRQGLNRIVVELPGIQDTTRARDILGKTATLDFMMVAHEMKITKSLKEQVPPGTRLFYDRQGHPILLKKRVVLTGDSITGASSGFDNQDGRPAINIRLGGNGIGLFKKVTKENIGKDIAVVYRETRMEDKYIGATLTKQKLVNEYIISVATIKNALGTHFQITGFSIEEARNLALLLRAGALPASVSIVEECIIGPSIGHDNIQVGMISIVVGLSLIFLFMPVYYNIFGFIANIVLLLNLVFLVATMSLIGATLTLPGIAGIVLTLGMAVDANVLIFERIREELRSGQSTQASIQQGFNHAFATIVDANLTTLIASLILFAIGTGPVKGFAITISIGIVTSMFTAIIGTRTIIDLINGTKSVKRLSIGI